MKNTMPEMQNMKTLVDGLMNDIGKITLEYKAQQLAKTYEDDDLLFCRDCGSVLPDNNFCSYCKEHN